MATINLLSDMTAVNITDNVGNSFVMYICNILKQWNTETGYLIEEPYPDSG